LTVAGTRPKATKPCAITLVLLVAGGLGCLQASRNVGTVRLNLSIPPGGPAVNAVHWAVVSSTQAVVRQGDIDTSDVNATASLDTSCPAGSGDSVVLTATATNGDPCTGTSLPFNVAQGASVIVTVQLVCGGGRPSQPSGSVVIGTTIVAGDNCPVFTSWQISPLQATSGSSVDVMASASDADLGEALTYAWTAPTGTFLDASAASTRYVCAGPGIQTLTLTVTDNHTPPCSTTVQFVVNCIGPDIRVEYDCRNSDSTQISFTLRLISEDAAPIPFSDITIRYWFTRDTTTPKVDCDYAYFNAGSSQPGSCVDLIDTFQPLSTPVANADTYLEIGFDAASGSLEPFHNNAQDQIQLRIHDVNYLPLVQTNDYSFDCSMPNLEVESPRITAYVRGVLKFGVEPL
jgi:hypothetical protein